MKAIAAILSFGVLLTPVGAAQERAAAGARQAGLRHLPGLKVQDPVPGRSATIVYGASLAQGASPVESARALLDRTRPTLGIEARSLELAVGADGRSILDIGWDRDLHIP